MSQPSSIEDDCALHRLRWLMRRHPLPIFAERSFQASVHFHGDVRLQTDALRKIVVRMVGGRRALLVELAIELVAALRQRIKPGHAFEVNEMIGLLRVLEGKLRRTAPAVGLWPQIGDLVYRRGPPKELRHVDRNLLRRHAINVGVPLIPHAKAKSDCMKTRPISATLISLREND